MDAQPPYEVSGFVLAGGRSSRMGQDKALMQLAGKTLAEHAVAKLRRVCAEVCVLSANGALAAYAPLVPDLHPGCGPLGGMHAALAHARYDWSLIVPVDVPFVPAALLEAWVAFTISRLPGETTRLAIHVVDGRPQPTLLLLHREVAGYLSDALKGGEYKVMPVLMAAAKDLAIQRGLALDDIFWRLHWTKGAAASGGPGALEVKEGFGARDTRLCFANLNTPEEFAEAEIEAGKLTGRVKSEWPPLSVSRLF